MKTPPRQMCPTGSSVLGSATGRAGAVAGRTAVPAYGAKGYADEATATERRSSRSAWKAYSNEGT